MPMYRALSAVFALSLFALIVSSPLFAQETENAATAPTAVETAADADAGEPAPTGVSRLELEKEHHSHRVNHGMRGKPYKKMLPSGFKGVIDAEQREKVYKMQEEYHHAIQRLHRRIDALEKERDREFMAVLTPEQLEKVKTFRQTPASLRPESPRRTPKAPKKAAAPAPTASEE